MTCIVGLVERDPKLGRRVWMGADSVAGDSNYYTVRLVTPKVFVKGDYIIGYTSSFRMGQILQYQTSLPKLDAPLVLDPPRDRLHAFMIQKFVPAVAKAFETDGWLQKEKDRKSGGQFLVGVGGELFEIEDDFAVLKHVDFDFSVVGSGMYFAQGAVYALRDSNNPRRRITTALDAAKNFNAYVRPPYTILKSRWYKETS